MLAAQKKQVKSVLTKLNYILPSIALFLLASLFLLLGTDSLHRVDSKLALAQTNQQASITLSQVAGVVKQPEIKIVNKNLPAPQFGAFAVLAADLDSGEILYQKNISTRYPPASTTKLMTALVAQDHFKSADVLTVTDQSLAVGSTMGLRAGEKLTFRSLLYGMLLDSGNDAAYTIATNYPGGLNNFIAQMNNKALELGLKDTHFQNPAGFDDPNQYASAYDLSKIARVAAADYQLARIVATKQTTILSWKETESSESAQDKFHVTHLLKNLNKLLFEPGVIGMKTGTTEKAGENLVGLVDRSDHKVVTVMLGSKDRFDETKSLIDWVYGNYEWQEN